VKPNFINGAQGLSGVEAFLCVAANSSFRKAAEKLGISPSAVSQQIRSLEERLGVPLLNRTTRSVGLTEAGQIFRARAAPALLGLQHAFEETSNLSEPAGLLRLHVPKGALPMLIEPILGEFCTRYPRIGLEVLTEDFVPDLIAGGFDAGVQLGENLAADSVALRLTRPIRFVVVGTPDYLERNGTPASPGDLRHHDCIGLRLDRQRTAVWNFLEGGRQIQMPISGRIVSDDYGLCVSAAANGLGLFQVAENIVEEALASGELCTVLDDYVAPSNGLFLHYPSRTQVMPKLRVFIDHVRRHLGR